MSNKVRIALISAGTSEQSSTTRLVTQIGSRAREQMEAAGFEVVLSMVELRDVGRDLGVAMATGSISAQIQRMFDIVAQADGVVVGTPVYKAGVSGLLKSFFDLADDDVVLATPLVLGATAGTPRHALVPDDQMRSLFAYLRALTVPTSVFAATEDYSDPRALNARAERAAGELAVLMQANTKVLLRDQGSGQYRRSFSAATDSSGCDSELDFDSDLMKLAAGGV